MAQRVGIVGASGYGGAELLRLLETHPGLTVAAVVAHSQAGRPVAELYPNLAGDALFAPLDLDTLAELDLVFLATPHDASLTVGTALARAGTPVVDLSGAFRLSGDDLAEWYGLTHPDPEVAATAVYGLTEWNRAAVREATLVANPGCYPTATLLALLPAAPLITPGTVVVDAKSGTSGAGRGLREDLHHAHVDGDVVAYGAPRHRHTIEIERQLAALSGHDPGAVSFTPHLMPIARGELTTCYATLRDGVGAHDLHAAYDDAYRDEPFVTVLAPGAFPHTKALHGSNGCHVGVVVDPRTRRMVATAAIDNLGKGAAGQALQNANLMLGLDETLGLTAVGVYP